MNACMTIEEIAAYDLQHNQKDRKESVADCVNQVLNMKKNGWHCDRINNTLFITKDEGAYVCFHTMTAETLKQLVKSVIQFYEMQFKRGKKFVYTYFTNPTLKRVFAKGFGAETFAPVEGNIKDKYKVIIDLEKLLKVKNTSAYYKNILGCK